jgi:CheY-like chemotaxis protein
VGMLGGVIVLESQTGVGSVFSFELLFTESNNDVSMPSFAKSSILESLEVEWLAPENHVYALIVDDNVLNRKILSLTLEGIGVETFMAESGRDALIAINKRLPDIVFTDYRMPEMDGIELLEKIQNQYANKTKTVIITASVFDFQREIHGKSNADDVLEKPFKAAQIYGCLKSLLNVEFIYRDVEPEVENTSDQFTLDLSGIPDTTINAILEAAEMGDVDVIIQQLRELPQYGKNAQELSAELSRLCENYDTDEIEALLK